MPSAQVRVVNSTQGALISVNNFPYGPDAEFQISEDERNNPNFHGCLNLNP